MRGRRECLGAAPKPESVGQARAFQRRLFDAMQLECTVHPVANPQGTPSAAYCEQEPQWQMTPAYPFHVAERVRAILRADHGLPPQGPRRGSLHERSGEPGYRETTLRPKGSSPDSPLGDGAPRTD